jgi:hypothetical protein
MVVRVVRLGGEVGMRGKVGAVVLLALVVATPGYSMAAVGDFITDPPTLLSPADSASSGLPLAISYTLPEAALPGSVKVTFAGSGTSTILTMVEDQVVSFAWDGAGASAPQIESAQGPALIDDTYDITLSYQDIGGNPAASDVATDVTIDAGTSTTTTVAITTTTLQATTTTTPTTTTTIPVTTTTVISTTTVPTPPTSSTTSTTLASPCGDPFNPGSITAGDALFVLRSAVGLEVCEVCICDIDGSGRTNTSDALSLLRIAQGLDGVLDCPPCDL